MTRVLVCGGRDFVDWDMLEKHLDTVHRSAAYGPITEVIHGAARGADSLADLWARRNKVAIHSCPANWTRDGRSAGPIRNQYMLTLKPSLCIAFKGGKGTLDMALRAANAGVLVQRIGWGTLL